MVNEPARCIGRNATASLSVVLMSNASASPVLAVSTIHETCARFDAQVILVTQSVLDSRTLRRMKELGVDVVQAGISAGRAEMCDLGMSRVTGSIVAVRDVADVGDATFLNAFLPVVPQVDALVVRHQRAVGEHEVRNTMVADRRPRADQAPPRESLVDLVMPRLGTAEMAANL